MGIGVAKKMKDPSSYHTDGLENSIRNEVEALVASCKFTALRIKQGKIIVLLC